MDLIRPLAHILPAALLVQIGNEVEEQWRRIRVGQHVVEEDGEVGEVLVLQQGL